MTTLEEADPKGLIREAYRIEGITDADCRTIFLDWALGAGAETQAALQMLLTRYGADAPEHPMTAVLRAGLESAAQPKRRGGRRGRTGG